MSGKKHIKGNRAGSALRVNPGVDNLSPISPDAAARLKAARKKELAVQDIVAGLISGNRTLLSKAITLVESSRADDREKAQEIIASCLPHSGRSIRIGITGVPGVGKSTFIETFGRELTKQGHRVAVLAVDPSSQRSKGSILGDKTRMEELSNDPSAFIRPSSTSGTLGGVTRSTRESIILCEAAGFDIIIVETVGVGQSEVAVNGLVDFFLLLMLPGAGDELQGIKRGIMEMADAIIIHKADGNNIEKARLARAEYENALHLFPPKENGWTPPVLLVSSVEKTGMPGAWDTILKYRDSMVAARQFEAKRRQQLQRVLDEALEESIRNVFFEKPDVLREIAACRKKIDDGEISPYQAASDIVAKYLRIDE